DRMGAWAISSATMLTDTAFGSSGFARADGGPASDSTYGIAVLPTGKIFAAGIASHTDYVGVSGEEIVVQLTSSGTLDTSFARNGVYRFALPTATTGFQAATVQPDGKPIALGYRNVISGNQQFVYGQRFNTDGTTDVSYVAS